MFFLTTSLFLAALSALPSPDDHARLQNWYEELGRPRDAEPFGTYLARAARLQHGIRYEGPPPPPGKETLHVALDAFECVSFIETALAVARCGWREEPTEACFTAELEESRYRRGELRDYSSRLHYFVDWIGDNASRGRVEDLTAGLGGEPIRKDFFYITQRELPRSHLGKEELAAVTAALHATEARLSAEPHPVLLRERAPSILRSLKDGDVIAFVRERPGMLVHHAGFIYWAGGTPRLLHASSYHQRVVITVHDVVDYHLRRPERRGFLVVRPLPPAR